MKHFDIIAAMQQRLDQIEIDRVALDFERREIETALAVVRRYAAETVPEAKPAVDVVDGGAMFEGEAVASSPETAEAGSRLDAGRTASATSEDMDATSPGGENPAPTTRSRVKALHDENPNLTRMEACEALGISEGSLASHGHALGIRWRLLERPQPAKPDGPPVEVEPSAGRAAKPKGTRFYLRDEVGRYLHFSCESMTSDKGHAWVGGERQLAGCRKAFPMARDLREHVVPKEARS